MSANDTTKPIGPSLTAKEMEIVFCVLQINQNDIKIDYSVLAERMGYSKASANTLWCRLRKKLLSPEASTGDKIAAEDLSLGTMSPEQNDGISPTKKSPSKRKLKNPAGAAPATRRKTVSRYIDLQEDGDEDVVEEDKAHDGLALSGDE